MRREEGQSFSSLVKEELVRLPAGRACCMLSEISAMTQTTGHLALRGIGSFSVSYRIENAGSARRLFILLKRRLGVNPSLHFLQNPRFGGYRTCVLTLTGEDARKLLVSLHMMETGTDGETRLKHTVPRHPLTRPCCRRAFFRGAFLGSGTLNSPERDYHFEWQAEDARLTETLRRLLEKSELPFHTYERRGKTVIYLKGAQEIADILTLMGATNSVLRMENIRAGRQLRASVARAANCDEHNGERALDASLAQGEAIRRIVRAQRLDSLPPALSEMATLRLAHPELTLRELGELLDPPISRSGVNHRLRRLVELSKQLKEEGECRE